MTIKAEQSKQKDTQVEIQRLNKIIEALMNRAERSMGSQGSDFSLFQTALTLENTVRERTRDLENTLRENERINRDLHRTTREMEEEILKRKRIQAALSDNERRYRTVMETALDAIILIDAAGFIQFVNPSVEHLFGYAESELTLQPLTQLFPDPSTEANSHSLYKTLEKTPSPLSQEHLEVVGRCQDGRILQLELSISDFWRGKERYFVAIARDISERKFNEGLRDNQFKILEMVAANQALYSVLEELVQSIDQQLTTGMASILLLSDDQVTIETCFAPGMPSAYNDALPGLTIGPQAGSCGTAMYSRETIIAEDIATDQRWEPFRELALSFNLLSCWSTPIISSNGQVLGSLAIYHHQPHQPDIAERQLVAGGVHLAGIAIERSQAEARIRHMAHHDALTDLPNRTLMEDRVNQAIYQVDREGGHAALLLIDLDRFKNINDSLGHQTGDQALCQVAHRLQQCIRASDTLSRLGGDEFVICVPHLTDSLSLTQLAEKILHILDEPFDLADLSLHIGASIGISLYPDDGLSSSELLRNADAAMYAAKDRGRGTFQFFTPALNESAHERLMLISQLRQAIDREEFELFFQPIFEVSSGGLVGAEALLRWRHPDRGLVGPDYFIPVLEDTGLMVTVGAWVLHQACLTNRRLQLDGFKPIKMAVNLSAVQLYQSDVCKTVSAALQASGLEPGWLTLEFTEAILLADTESMIQTMHDLKALGVDLALDDFGTGYSSLSYLQRFPVDRLKIDRSFMLESMLDSNAAHIVHSIVQLSDKLGLISIAEGIETPEQLALMRQFGCNQLQGYLFSRPLPAEDFIDYLTRLNTSPPDLPL